MHFMGVFSDYTRCSLRPAQLKELTFKKRKGSWNFTLDNRICMFLLYDDDAC